MLAVLLVALGVALVRPELFGLLTVSPFAAGDGLRATVLATPSTSAP